MLSVTFRPFSSSEFQHSDFQHVIVNVHTFNVYTKSMVQYNLEANSFMVFDKKSFYCVLLMESTILLMEFIMCFLVFQFMAVAQTLFVLQFLRIQLLTISQNPITLLSSRTVDEIIGVKGICILPSDVFYKKNLPPRKV